MTKGQLKTLILKLRSLTGLSEPAKITYFVDDEGLVNFKLWFNSLIIPKGLLGVDDDEDKPTVWNQTSDVKDFRKGFSKLDYNKDYDDDYVIKQINTDEGFIVILPDDQNYKVVDKGSKENVNESVVFERKNRLTEAEKEGPSDEEIKSGLESNGPAEAMKAATNKDENGKPTSEHYLLIVPIPCAIDLNEEEVGMVMKAISDNLGSLQVTNMANPVDIKLIARPMAGFAQMDQYATMIKTLVNQTPDAPAGAILVANDVNLQKYIEGHKGGYGCLKCNPTGFKVIEGFADPTKKMPSPGDDKLKAPTAFAAIEAAQTAAFASSKKRMDAQMSAFVEKILPFADKFRNTLYDEYIKGEEKEEEKPEEDKDKSEKDSTEKTNDKPSTDKPADSAKEESVSPMLRLLKMIREDEENKEGSEEEKKPEEDSSKEKAEDKSEKKDEEKKEKGGSDRNNAWKEARDMKNEVKDIVPFQVANLMSAYSVSDVGGKLKAYGAEYVAKEAASNSMKKQNGAKSGEKASDVTYKPGEVANYGISKMFASHTEGHMQAAEGGTAMLYNIKKDPSDKLKGEKTSDGDAENQKKINVFDSASFGTFCCLKGVQKDFEYMGDVPYNVVKEAICTTHSGGGK